ncbi:helix-turn-helix domain-containing protein [Nocardia sp. NPDC020380]|uniref:helix-turn-helix domain-containing protein n=1 Tax=Nocardia sp. NPDC020380 TaxID=3364309 RepID=UPI00379452AD
MGGQTVGQRLEFRRRRRGLSRKVVANLVGRSEEWLRLVESGQRKLDSLEVLARLAEVLQIDDVTELIDWPSRVIPHTNVEPHECLRELREVIIDHPALRIRSNRPVDDYDQAVLTADLRTCRQVWTGSAQRYSQLTRTLPDVIEAARSARWQLQNLETADQLVEAYHIARHLLSACGDHSMAATVADRAMGTAAQVHQPLLIAASAWHVATALLHSGHPVESHDYALAAACRLTETGLSTPDSDIIDAALRLLASHAAAVAGDLTESAGLLSEAKTRAVSFGADRTARGIPFGPSEVGITTVEMALAQHDPDQAIRLAPAVPLFEGQSYERRAAYHICQARAYVLRREDAEATLALMKIANVSPEDIRYDAEAHHCVQHLLRRDNYLTRTEVGYLAKLAGISR